METFGSIKFYIKEKIDINGTLSLLDNYGYNRCRKVSMGGDYSYIGELLIVYPITFEYPVRVDLSEGIVRSIKSVDLGTFKTIDRHNGVIVLPVGTLRRRKARKSLVEGAEQPINSFVDIEPGDFVVHLDYGIGKYLGIQRLEKKGVPKDFFVLEYAGGDKLFVGHKDLQKIQRYVSFHRKCPELNDLKGKRWAIAKKRASTGAAKMAKDFLEVQARRENTVGFSFAGDTDWQKVVENAFPYKETPDQLRATKDVKIDMERRRPMDRLLCGDV